MDSSCKPLNGHANALGRVRHDLSERKGTPRVVASVPSEVRLAWEPRGKGEAACYLGYPPQA
jgi:hypothetical protein